MMQDLLFIELDNFTSETVYFLKTEDDKTIRKGKFTGTSIQLNLTHLPSGHYLLGLNHDEDLRTYYFEKQGDDYIFTGQYNDNSTEKLIA
jgi:hypothetical protein